MSSCELSELDLNGGCEMVSTGLFKTQPSGAKQQKISVKHVLG